MRTEPVRTRVCNFNGGPAALPLPVLERAHEEFFDFAGTGVSILESSFRAAPYAELQSEAIGLLRELYAIPDHYKVLLLQGGASQQFAMLPMNLLGANESADYILTGLFSQLAANEAQTVGRVRIAGSSESAGFARIPRQQELALDERAAYAHITENNTAEGTEYASLPNVGSVPLIADMSSTIFSRRVDISRYGLIYAGAQKNLGPAGVTVVIVREDLLEKCSRSIPTIFRYATHGRHDSVYNTPPTFAVYLLRNFFAWAKAEGGLVELESRNREKARLMYELIDRHPELYRCAVHCPLSRSRMNIVLRLPSAALEAQFLSAAADAGVIGLKNHPAVGGVRISLYNGISIANVHYLRAFMEDFASAHRSPSISGHRPSVSALPKSVLRESQPLL